MIRKTKRATATRAIEMVVPFSLDETLEIIESVQAQNRMFRRFTVTIDEHDDELIVFRVCLNVSDLFGMGRFDCFGELQGDRTYNTTMLQWLPSKIYRKSDFLFGILFGVWILFLIAISPINTPLDFIFPLGFLLIALILIPIDRMARRNKRINYIRKKVENRLFDAMNSNLGNAD